MRAWSPELELVARLSRIEPSADDEVRVRALAETSVDWDRVVRLAWHHGVAPLAHAAVGRFDIPRVPAGLRERLRQLRLSSLRGDLAAYHGWLELCNAFEQRKIRALTLKGFPVVLSVYGQLGLRPVSDLDFLVQPEDVSGALAVLAGQGYRLWPVWEAALRHVGLQHILRHKGEIGLMSERGVVVDLHWEAIPRETTLPIDELMAGAEVLRVAGQGILVPAPDAALALLLLHGHKSAWARLRWLVDVAELMDKQSPIEHERVNRRLEAIGMLSARSNALRLIESLWGRVPASVRDLARYERAVQPRALRHAREVIEREQNWDNIYDQWRPVRTLWDRVSRIPTLPAAVASAARPGYFDWAFVSLPKPFRWAYYVVRPIRLLTQALGKAVRLPAGAEKGTEPAAPASDAGTTRRRVWRVDDATPLTLVTAIYDSGPSSLIGGRGRGIPFYLPSLINIANLGAPIVVYCSRDAVRAVEAAIAPHFRDHRVIAYELSEFEHFDAVLEWKRAYVRDLPVNDRNELLCFLKSYWLQRTATDNPFDHDRYCWIDAGLTHHGIVPERIGGVELLVDHAPTHYYPHNKANIFTPDLGAALAHSLTRGRLFFCALPFAAHEARRSAYEQLTAATFGVPRDRVRIDDHLVGGLFGGYRDDLQAVHRLYAALLKEFIDSRTYTLEEQVFSSLNAVYPELFSLQRFGTWKFYSRGERTSRLDAEGDSFYRIFMRLGASVANG